MRAKFLVAIAVATTALGSLASSADATVIGQTVNIDLKNQDYALSFGASNQASYTFAGGNFAFGSSRYNSPDSIMTDGSALVSSSGGGFLGKPVQPKAFSTNGIGLLVSSDLFSEYKARAFETATPIPASRGPGYLALKFQLRDGTHFGYAQLDNNELVRYGYQSDPGAGIQAGAISSSPATVPEPASWAVLSLGLGLIGGWLTIARARLGRVSGD